MDLTPDQIDFYERVENIRMKKWVTITFLVIICVILVVFIVLCFMDGKKTEKYILGAIEGILAYTAGPLAKHFFPAFNRAIKKTSTKKPLAQPRV